MSEFYKVGDEVIVKIVPDDYVGLVGVGIVGKITHVSDSELPYEVIIGASYFYFAREELELRENVKQAKLQKIQAKLQKIKEYLAHELSEAYESTRCWSAWSYGTMSEDDFEHIGSDEDRIENIAKTILELLEKE